LRIERTVSLRSTRFFPLTSLSQNPRDRSRDAPNNGRDAPTLPVVDTPPKEIFAHGQKIMPYDFAGPSVSDSTINSPTALVSVLKCDNSEVEMTAIDRYYEQTAREKALKILRKATERNLV
jgi:hypothetical protein